MDVIIVDHQSLSYGAVLSIKKTVFGGTLK